MLIQMELTHFHCGEYITAYLYMFQVIKLWIDTLFWNCSYVDAHVYDLLWRVKVLGYFC
jgi:hypothetical protein